MSRQAKWQQTRRENDMCRTCGKPTTAYVTKSGTAKQYAYCDEHRAQGRKRYQRIKLQKEN